MQVQLKKATFDIRFTLKNLPGTWRLLPHPAYVKGSPRVAVESSDGKLVWVSWDTWATVEEKR